MPYKSLKQERFFHTQTARDKGIKMGTVKEFDRMSKGMKLPMRAKGMGGSGKLERMMKA